jgi:tetratricopeptide (TPR) repeat protein
MRFELGRDAEALQAYQDAIARYPDHERTPWAWYQMGLIHRRNGNDAKALETFNLLVEMAKTRPGELWEGLAKDNQRELTNVLKYRDYLNQ